MQRRTLLDADPGRLILSPATSPCNPLEVRRHTPPVGAVGAPYTTCASERPSPSNHKMFDRYTYQAALQGRGRSFAMESEHRPHTPISKDDPMPSHVVAFAEATWGRCGEPNLDRGSWHCQRLPSISAGKPPFGRPLPAAVGAASSSPCEPFSSPEG